MATVVLVGTLDTKAPEYAFLRRRAQDAGCDVIGAGALAGVVPVDALSMVGAPGGPFRDPGAAATLIRELGAELRPDIEVVEMTTGINDPALAQAMAQRFDERYRADARGRSGQRREEVHGGRRITTAASAAH